LKEKCNNYLIFLPEFLDIRKFFNCLRKFFHCVFTGKVFSFFDLAVDGVKFWVGTAKSRFFFGSVLAEVKVRGGDSERAVDSSIRCWLRLKSGVGTAK